LQDDALMDRINCLELIDSITDPFSTVTNTTTSVG